MAAAVADFRPAAVAGGKIKKAGRDSLELELEATTDVLSALASQRRDGQTIVGFAAEHGDDAARAADSKLISKALDALVVNDISRRDIGFNVDANEVTIVSARNGEIERSHVARASKRAVADAILDAVGALRGAG
jgi:phosphopantothenoylcysteine decarboxylase / phosphopantothenate---cysteine ligase